MDFLESLYSIPNFDTYLFIIIGILIVLFLVILLFGRKDSKKTKVKQEETQTETLMAETTEPVKVEIPATEPTTPEMVPTEVAPVLTEVSENPIVMPVEPVPTTVEPVVPVAPVTVEAPAEEIPKEEKEFDFDALAAAISKELESIDKKEEPVVVEKPQAPVLEQELEAPLRYEIPKVEEPKPVVEEVKPVVKEEPVKPRPAMPTVFSSVYVNREAEQPKEEVKEEPVKPEPPKIELPKIVGMPKVSLDEPATTSDNDDLIFR